MHIMVPAAARNFIACPKAPLWPLAGFPLHGTILGGLVRLLKSPPVTILAGMGRADTS